MDLRQYLTFSKRERIGIITLVFIMTGLALLPKFWKKPPPKIEVLLPVKQSNYEKPRYEKSRYEDSGGTYERNENYPEQRQRWTNYDQGYERRSNYKKYYRNSPYYNSDHGFKNYQNQNDYRKEKREYSSPAQYHSSGNYERAPPRTIEINSADTAAFIALPGIGNKLASRIIQFREKLGGFYSVQQVGEVYGIPDSSFQKFARYLTCDAASIRKLEINVLDKDVLRKHPYIRWALANTIIAYRDAHGSFASSHDLEKLNTIDSITLKKLIPYLTF